ncbi:SAP DOMAIN-CONTAINING PROTEIN [Salix koriyanagi]|uniref:SAP DOMAIN-CONTAINING PROTEIN n=1 Tax=Salix koriyanagi TaxID=2511006 RepID=A0A9Q0P5I8_9ROSI|nr:SAP DOMAIN-CONTAINING PROTEIN [Salix koriyanagi]KAJ6682029.1 SAP DOMAIN-CONTAINING PROTEIN [Salix koriyanagi]
MAPDSDRKYKRRVFCLSSSSSSEDNCDDDEFEEISGDDSNYSEEEEDGGEEEEESVCERVVSLLKEGNELEGLYLKHCKAYLRHYGLRLAGTKAVCIQRIKEHWRLKDGNGEELNPRSSFFINCRGDVCKGDVVMFVQKVYSKFNNVTRHGKILGSRTVAGRVVNESYGSAKQQHTFTVEVLWNKGVKKLPPLSPLLVKGRNLYKLRTFRQRWNNEAERQKILAEKHKRGTAARLARTMKKSTMAWSENGDAKCHKRAYHSRPSQMRKVAELEKRKHIDGCRRDTSQLHKTKSHHQQALGSVNVNRNMSLYGSKTFRKHEKRRNIDVDMGPTPQAYACNTQCISQIEPHERLVPLHSPRYDTDSSSTKMALPAWRPYADTIVMPAQYQGVRQNSGTNYDYANFSYSFERRNFHR